MAPLLSILIPTYNREAYIEQCIASVLEQPFSDFEIIISDNASTDRTCEIIQNIQAGEPRIKLLRQPSNMGPVPNWKTCLDAASGRFIHWLWSDDYVDASFYGEWNSFQQQSGNAGKMFCCATNYDDCGDISPAYRYPSDSYSWKELIQKLLDFPAIPVSPAAYVLPAAAVRKHFYNRIPANGSIDCVGRAIGVDFLMVAGTLRDLGTVHLCPKPMVFFRKHMQSISVLEIDSLHVHYIYALLWFLLQSHTGIPWRKRWKLYKKIKRMNHPSLTDAGKKLVLKFF